MLRVFDIRLPIDHDEEDLKRSVLRKLGIKENDLDSFRVFRRSIDARRKYAVQFVYTVDAKVKENAHVPGKRRRRRVITAPIEEYRYVENGKKVLRQRPVIVGSGPAGLFAGLVLAEMGYRPLILERGPSVEKRIEDVRKFMEAGRLSTESNIQFGEGGAGTFSDGKLYTLIKGGRSRKVFEEFVAGGAPREILFDFRPHIGSDKLPQVVKNIRLKINAHGGEVRFESKVTGIIVKDGSVRGVLVNGSVDIPASVVVLAIGHSARDTFTMLYDKGLEMAQKPFAMGVRIEHHQNLVDQAQYGSYAGHPSLGAAEYKFVYHSSQGRTAYTFCMCPGGVVVAAASEEGGVVTNGMSEYKRDGENANSAILVNIKPDDFGSRHPLAGIEFQRKWEKRAFDLGGSDYKAPIQRVEDFIKDRPTAKLGLVSPSYRPGFTMAELRDCLPDFVAGTIREALPHFDMKMESFAYPDAVLTGVETRSSSPLRIMRGKSRESSIRGLYPAGEGAGYAGGIVTAAVDGIRTAETIAQKYSPV